MASASPIRYVHQLPYTDVKALGQLLDPGNVWAEIGGSHGMGLDVTTFSELDHKYRILRQSPTEALIKNFAAMNYTINDLYLLLLKMEHHQAMGIIKPYVDAKYHSLHSEGNRLRYPVETDISLSSKNVLKPQNHQQQPRFNSESKLNNYKYSMDFDETNAPSKTISTKKFNMGSSLSSCRACHLLECRCNGAGYPESSPHAPLVPESNISGPSDSSITALTDRLSASESVIQLSFDDIVTCTENFKQSNIVGKGGFGTVYKGKLRSNVVAVKVIHKKNIPGPPAVQEAKLRYSYEELKALNRYRHENILVLHGYSFQLDCLCLVYQYMVNGSLEDRLQCKNGTEPLSWPQRCNILMGTACGLQYLHTITTAQFIHGDIKSANILLDSRMQAKIGDFGLAREGPHTEGLSFTVVSIIKGTQAYLPSEYLCGNQLSTKVDVYSFGVVMYEVGTGRRAYDESRPISEPRLLVDIVESWPEAEMDRLIDTNAGSEHCHVYLKLMSLGKSCTKKAKKQRPDMELVHETLKDLIKNMTEESKQSNMTTASVRTDGATKPPGQKSTPLPNETEDSCRLRDHTPPPAYSGYQHSQNGIQQYPAPEPREPESPVPSSSSIQPLPTVVRMGFPDIPEIFAICTATGK